MRSTRRQKRSWGRVKWVIALIVIAAGLVYAWNNLGLRGAMRGTTPEAGQMTAENVVHVMILGVDQREDDVGRSDTLMPMKYLGFLAIETVALKVMTPLIFGMEAVRTKVLPSQAPVPKGKARGY